MSTKRFFCDNCESLLDEKFDKEMIYECPTCRATYQPGPDDIIVEQYTSDNSNVQHYSTMVKLAPFSPVDMKVRRNCSSCGRAIMALTPIGPNLLSVYSCVCGNIEH